MMVLSSGICLFGTGGLTLLSSPAATSRSGLWGIGTIGLGLAACAIGTALLGGSRRLVGLRRRLAWHLAPLLSIGAFVLFDVRGDEDISRGLDLQEAALAALVLASCACWASLTVLPALAAAGRRRLRRRTSD